MPRQGRGSRFGLTTEKILAKSGQVFNRRGYGGTTLDDIARALGVTKAALYYYVQSKEEILFQCHQRSLDIGMEGIRQALSRSSAPDEQLKIAIAYYIEGMTDHLRGTAVLLDEGALSPRRHRQIIARRDEYERMLRRIIEEGIAAGVFVPCDPKLVGFAILGAMNWIPKWYNPSGKRSAGEIAEAFSSYLVRALQKRPSIDALSATSE